MTQIEFMIESAEFEIGLIRYNVNFRIFVDDQPASGKITSDAVGTGIHYKLTFASRNPRKITIVGVNIPFYRLMLTPGDTIWAAPDDKPLMCVAGDSYSFGSGGAGSVAFAWAQLFGRALGYRVIVDAVGGTGWNTAGSDSPITRLAASGANAMIKRIAGVNISRAPDKHFAAYGLNDVGGNMTTLSQNASAYFGASAVKPTFIGPWTPLGENGNLLSIKTALQSVAAGLSANFVDVSTFVTADNKAALTDVDNQHPTLYGHNYLGIRTAQKVRRAAIA